MGSAPWGGSREEGKISTHLKNPSQAVLGRDSKPQKGIEQQVLGRQSGEN